MAQAVTKRNCMHAAAGALAGGAWATVLDWTPAEPIEITAFSADIAVLTDVRYRMRLRVDEVVKWEESVSVGTNSRTPVDVDVEVGQRVRIDVFHQEVAGQNGVASIGYKHQNAV